MKTKTRLLFATARAERIAKRHQITDPAITQFLISLCSINPAALQGDQRIISRLEERDNKLGSLTAAIQRHERLFYGTTNV